MVSRRPVCVEADVFVKKRGRVKKKIQISFLSDLSSMCLRKKQKSLLCVAFHYFVGEEFCETKVFPTFTLVGCFVCLHACLLNLPALRFVRSTNFHTKGEMRRRGDEATNLECFFTCVNMKTRTLSIQNCLYK